MRIQKVWKAALALLLGPVVVGLIIVIGPGRPLFLALRDSSRLTLITFWILLGLVIALSIYSQVSNIQRLGQKRKVETLR